jgi:hypothetical protein
MRDGVVTPTMGHRQAVANPRARWHAYMAAISCAIAWRRAPAATCPSADIEGIWLINSKMLAQQERDSFDRPRLLSRAISLVMIPL